MSRAPGHNDRLSRLITELISRTNDGEIRWEKQRGSAHRYARWRNNLLILGPAAPLSETEIPRYLFITPFDSPACVEVNSSDAELGPALMELVRAVEEKSKDEPPTDPFALTDEVLGGLT